MDQDLIENEYSAQHYGFTPEIFFRDFSDLILEEMTFLVQEFVKEFSTQNVTRNSEENNQLMKEFLQIHNNFGMQAEISLKNLQPIIKTFFTIPPNVLLPANQHFKNQYTEENIKKLETEVKELEEQYSKKIEAIQICKNNLKIRGFKPVYEDIEKGINILKNVKETFDGNKKLEKLANVFSKSRKELLKLDNTAIPDDIVIFSSLFKCMSDTS